MHARFNLDPEQKTWSEYFEVGNVIHKNNKVIVESKLDKYQDADGVLQADKLIGDWFPTIQADVFLSHSHKDESLVIGFAGWLYEKFGLSSFIDSTVWGYSDELLKAIDNKYCKNYSGETYIYELRNRSTSHVHMMLSTALTDMIDRSECIIFVNTPHSFKPADYLKTEGKTESPWIYSEIAMTRMLRQRSPEEHRPRIIMDGVNASMEHIKEARELRVSYPTDLFHLTPLSIDDLNTWARQEFHNGKRKSLALDSLYKMKAC